MGADQLDPPIELAARDDRAHEGSPDITTWCPKCEENAVPMKDGTCGFCDTQLVEAPAEAWPHTNGTVRRQHGQHPDDERRPGQVKRAREGTRAHGPILSPAAPPEPEPEAVEPDDIDDELGQERTRIDPTQS